MSRRRQKIAMAAGLLALCQVAAGCTQQGDLGRYRHPLGLTQDSVLFTAFFASPRDGETHSSLIYTDSERALREIGDRLLVPVHVEPAWSDDWLSLAAYDIGWGAKKGNDPVAYYRRLTAPAEISQDVIWNRLERDIDTDAQTLRQFIPVAGEVYHVDQRRLGAPETGVDMRHAVELRQHENTVYVNRIGRAAQERLLVYRHAMENAAREAPSDRQGSVVRAYDGLAALLASPGNWLRTTDTRGHVRKSMFRQS